MTTSKKEGVMVDPTELRATSLAGVKALAAHHEARADAAEAEADRLRAFLSAGSIQMLESEQAWKRRALSAEQRADTLLRERDEAVGALREIEADMADDDAANKLTWGHAKDALEIARTTIAKIAGEGE